MRGGVGEEDREGLREGDSGIESEGIVQGLDSNCTALR